MTEFEAASLLFYAIQCLLIWTGIRQMGRASERREKAETQRHEELMSSMARAYEANEREGARRHEETMVSLKAMIASLTAMTEKMARS